MMASEQLAASTCESQEDLLKMVLFDDVVLDHQDDPDDIRSPITAQLFDFCDEELFPAQTLTSSDGDSCSNCCHEENSFYSAGGSLPQDINFSIRNDDAETNIAPATMATTEAMVTTATTDNECSNLSTIFDLQDDMDNDISASLNFSSCGPFSAPQYLVSADQEDQFEIPQRQPQIVPSCNGVTQFPTQVVGPLVHTHSLPPVFEDECLSSIPPFTCVDPSSSGPHCTLLDLSLAPYMLDNLSPTLSAADSFVGSNLFMGSEIPHPHTLGYQEDCNSYFCPEAIHRGFYSGEIQSICSESARHWMRSGAGNQNPNPSSTSEIASMDETSYKVGKLSVEQRKEKIHRYMKKRTERNFSKKIKYACRKSLADSRPRVKGRFAKNDEFGHEQSSRANYSHQEDDEDDDITVKEEDELLSSSDIFSHISGVNSFNYNCPIQSWT